MALRAPNDNQNDTTKSTSTSRAYPTFGLFIQMARLARLAFPAVPNTYANRCSSAPFPLVDLRADLDLLPVPSRKFVAPPALTDFIAPFDSTTATITPEDFTRVRRRRRLYDLVAKYGPLRPDDLAQQFLALNGASLEDVGCDIRTLIKSECLKISEKQISVSLPFPASPSVFSGLVPLDFPEDELADRTALLS